MTRTRRALLPLADAELAAPMAAYMKGIAPFLGVRTDARRGALRSAWAGLAVPTSDDLGSAARALFVQRGREFHYAGADLIHRFRADADDRFLADHVEALLLTTPWWDTVDALGTAAVSPLCRRATDRGRSVAERWSASGDRWLVRAAIQHQRGWKADTDLPFVLGLCGAHATSREFFVVKAIGWALRDLAVLDAAAVHRFLAGHPRLGAVAVTEARKGLARADARR